MTIITILNPDGTAFGVERRELAHHITKTGIFFIDPNEANEIQWASTDKERAPPDEVPDGILRCLGAGEWIYQWAKVEH